MFKEDFTCECCKEKITSDNSPYGANYVENYGYICEECFINDYFNVCIECERTFRNDNLQMIDTGSGYICEECFPKNYGLELVEIHKENNSNNFSMLIKETILTKHTFWIDCIENEDGFYTWEFNQYIFDLYNSKDMEIKRMQELFLSEHVLEDFNSLIDCLICEAIEKGGILNESDK